ncbi:MAG: c-type cytochrome [Neomegalonema sp.]|nr:c-type cytochrome [Neomegalonema sp.]
MRTLLLATALLALPFTAAAQEYSKERIAAGEREFASSCAACHGRDGKGKGPMAKILTTAPADLTQLAKANDGAFPFGRIYKIIDGRTLVAAHGAREMPIWGSRYNTEAEKSLSGLAGTASAEVYVAAKILFLIDYIASIQE